MSTYNIEDIRAIYSGRINNSSGVKVTLKYMCELAFRKGRAAVIRIASSSFTTEEAS